MQRALDRMADAAAADSTDEDSGFQSDVGKEPAAEPEPIPSVAKVSPCPSGTIEDIAESVDGDDDNRDDLESCGPTVASEDRDDDHDVGQDLDDDLDEGHDQDLDQDLNQDLDQDLDEGHDQDLDQGLGQGLDQDLDQGFGQCLDHVFEQGQDQERDQDQEEYQSEGEWVCIRDVLADALSWSSDDEDEVLLCKAPPQGEMAELAPAGWVMVQEF